MNEFLMLFLEYALVKNFILVMFLGLCPFFGVSKKLKEAIPMGIAVTFVMLCASVITWLISQEILIPFDIEFMRIVVFILVIASFVQLIEMMRGYRGMYADDEMANHVQLITTNCAIMGIVEINFQESYSLLGSVASSHLSLGHVRNR